MPIIIDLEATCANDESIDRRHMEIIEIGAVAVLADGQVVDQFCEFIRPRRHPQLTDFCTELTSITQEQVDAADEFPLVERRFAAFVERHRTFAPDDWWGSWGQYDFNQLAQDVAYHRVGNPLPQRHRNLKEEFTARQNLKKRAGLDSAVTLAGLTFLGTHHRGIDDARNIAQLLPWIDGEEKLAPAPVQAWRNERRRQR